MIWKEQSEVGNMMISLNDAAYVIQTMTEILTKDEKRVEEF